MDMKLQGSVGFARRSDGYIVMHLRDEDAAVEFCEVKFTPEQFANAVTGLFGQEVQISVRGLEKLGKKHECVRVAVHALNDEVMSKKLKDISREEWADMVEHIETEGWVVDGHDWGNHHQRFGANIDSFGGYYCTARRWT